MPEITVTLALSDEAAEHLQWSAKERWEITVDELASSYIQQAIMGEITPPPVIPVPQPAQTLEVPLTEREASLLAKWNAPEHIVGRTLQDRVQFLIDHQCIAIETDFGGVDIGEHIPF